MPGTRSSFLRTAKWIRGGTGPYAGADADARAIDTRTGTPSELAMTIDRALRARPRDDAMKGLVVRFLVDGASDAGLRRQIEVQADSMRRLEEAARDLAMRYVVDRIADVAVCDARGVSVTYDKTELLLLGQERARVAVVHDDTTVTMAAGFESGIDFLALLGIEGGMPTRVSVPAERLSDVLDKLGVQR